MKLDIAYTSSAGGRKSNQDSVGFTKKSGGYCLAVADGVGGYSYGEYASKLTVQHLKELFVQQPVISQNNLRQHIERTADFMGEVVQKNPEFRSMRTTLAAVYLNQERIVTGYVGDSRIYIFRNSQIYFCSQDHSLVMEMVQRGELPLEQLRGHPKRNVITSSVGGGQPNHIDIETHEIPLESIDGLLLCSDGFWELLSEREMINLLTKTNSAGQWLQEMEQRVGNRQTGRSDNYTCLAARSFENNGTRGSGLPCI